MSYADWVAWVKSMGGTVGVWINQTLDDGTPDPNYGNPAGIWTTAQYAALAGTSAVDPSGAYGFTFPTTMTAGSALTNAANTLVFVLADTMTGDASVEASVAGTNQDVAASGGQTLLQMSLGMAGQAASGAAGAVSGAVSNIGQGIEADFADLESWLGNMLPSSSSWERWALWGALGVGGFLLVAHVIDKDIF
jgi:hypothetical protein